jgi:hypothetical protein
LVGLLGWGISPSQGCYLHIGKHKHRINAHKIHASSGIRTYNLSVGVDEDSSCLILRSHCYQHILCYYMKNKQTKNSMLLMRKYKIPQNKLNNDVPYNLILNKSFPHNRPWRPIGL